ncbi:segregation/condensation protein A [Planctomycetales bacterium]|nr:segregation/condensation protein A [Planctomycetales bacterium]
MFSVRLPFFQGPLDLLLYLIRKNELDIEEVSVALLLEQYLDYISILKEINLDLAGDFLATASILLEIKVDAVVNGKEVAEPEVEEPRQELVKQLLEYKKYCDAAAQLQQQSERWQLQLPRLANDLPPRQKNPAAEPIREVELWDLVSAFGRILRDNSPQHRHEVVYDDTPISTYMKRIHQRLCLEERVSFRQLFSPGQHKTALIGIFMASLELVRHEYADIFQEDNFGEIELYYRKSSKPLDFASLDNAA